MSEATDQLVRIVEDRSDTPELVTVPPQRPRPGVDAARSLFRSIGSAWLLVALLLIYELYATWRGVAYLPRLSETFQHMRQEWLSTDWHNWFLSDQFWRHGAPSLKRFFLGWSLSILIGVSAGIVLGLSRTLAELLNPAIRFSMAIPKTVLLPLALVFFGVRDSMNVFLILVGAVWVVLINTMDGVAGIDSMWIRSARSLRLGRVRMLFRVILPAASPQIFAGLRVSLGIGLILMVVSELYATTRGIGYQITLAQRTFKYLDMWAAIMVIAIIGILLNGLFGVIERRSLRWHHRDRLRP